MTKPNSKSILYIIGSLGRGGCEAHLSIVLPMLVRAGYKVTLFLLADRGELGDSLEQAGVHIVNPIISSNINQKWNILFRLFRLSVVSLQLLSYILIKQPPIVHFFLPASYWLGGPICLLSGKRKLLMSRRSMNDYKQDRKIIKWLESFLHKRMDFLLGNSKAVVDQLIEETKSTDRIGLIYNGIERLYSKVHNRSNRTKYDIPMDCFVMVIVANLIPYKGHKDLIDALAIAQKKIGKNWRLLVVGRDDGVGDSLQKQINLYGLKEHVIIMGARNDVADILPCADVGLLVSHQEGFSNAILEGMAAGLPMIVTAVGGNAEAVINGETGIVVPVKDVKAISNAIVNLYEEASLRKKFGKNGKIRVHEEFSIEKCIEQYDKLYQKLLG